MAMMPTIRIRPLIFLPLGRFSFSEFSLSHHKLLLGCFGSFQMLSDWMCLEVHWEQLNEGVSLEPTCWLLGIF